MTLPTPGSAEAGDQGCTCPVRENAYGRGVPRWRADGLDPVEHPSFYIAVGCPVHGAPTEAEIALLMEAIR